VPLSSSIIIWYKCKN